MYLLPIINPPLLTTTDSDFASVLFSCAMYSLVAIGLNIVIGYAGLLDLGYVGFFAVGAFTVGVLSSAHGTVPLLIAFPIAMAVTLVSGVLLGAPTLRVRGDYLAIVTLGFGEIIRLVLLNTQWLGGASGIANIPSPPSWAIFEIPHITWEGLTAFVDLETTTTFLEFTVVDAVPYYWLALTLVLIVLFLDWLMQNSRVGRAWEATREDEDAAELMGVPDVPLQAAGVRDRRGHRRPVGSAVRHPAGLHQPRQLLDHLLGALRRHGRRRWPGQPLGCGLRSGAADLAAREVPLPR